MMDLAPLEQLCIVSVKLVASPPPPEPRSMVGVLGSHSHIVNVGNLTNDGTRYL